MPIFVVCNHSGHRMFHESPLSWQPVRSLEITQKVVQPSLPKWVPRKEQERQQHSLIGQDSSQWNEAFIGRDCLLNFKLNFREHL